MVIAVNDSHVCVKACKVACALNATKSTANYDHVRFIRYGFACRFFSQRSIPYENEIRWQSLNLYFGYFIFKIKKQPTKLINFSIFIDILKNIKVGCWLNYDFQNNSELSMAADQNRIFNKGSSIWLHKEITIFISI